MVSSSENLASGSPPTPRALHIITGSTASYSSPSTSSGKGAAGDLKTWSPESPRQQLPILSEENGENIRKIRGNRSIDRFSSESFSSTSSASRRDSLEPGGSPTAITTTNSTNFATVSPATPRLSLRLHSLSLDAVPQIVSTSTSPQRRAKHIFASSGLNSSITTPTTGIPDASPFWQSPQHSRAQNALVSSNPPMLPDLDLLSPQSFDFAQITQLTPSSPLKPSKTAITPQQPSRRLSATNSSRAKGDQPKTRSHRSHSQKAMLSSALAKANTAVTLDNAENYEGAMEAYGDACVLLGQVMMRAGAEDDRKKLQAIQETYKQRIEELRALSLNNISCEKQLPARPLTEEFTDQESLYPVEDDDSAVIITTAVATQFTSDKKKVNGASDPGVLSPKDSLIIGPDVAISSTADPLPPLPVANLQSAEPVIQPLSPRRPPPPSPESERIIDVETLNRSFSENEPTFAFGTTSLSPRFSLQRDRDYGVRRSSSDASSLSSRRSSQRHSNLSNCHSRQGSEVSTSWLNTINESAGSASGDESPKWTKKRPKELDLKKAQKMQPRDISFEEDFDTQLDAAVDAAYDDGYEVDFSYDRDEELVMMRSPRENVERAKERVREVEREMELEIQKERERRLERERLALKPRLDSELDFYDDADDDESEEERMLEEMTRGYTLDDFDFGMESKTALPRESASTAYSDSTLPRESTSSGYSSGVTWSSSNNATSKSLTPVDEAPATPPPNPTSAQAALEVKTALENENTIVTIPPPTSLPPSPPKSDPAEHLTASNVAVAGLAVSKSQGVRSRRLSARSEPLKIETATLNTIVADISTVPITVIREPSPQPPSDPPPVPPVTPTRHSSSLGLSPSRSRPGTATGIPESILEEPAEVDSAAILSPPLLSPNLEPPSAAPLSKTVSDDGSPVRGRSGSPVRYTPRMPGIPGSLRQIQSSASLKSRNMASPEAESPGNGVNSLFASSSASNLRKAFPRSNTPATPMIVPMTPMGPLPTAGFPSGGMHLFDNKFHSPSTPGKGDTLAPAAPAPLEPCPPEPLSKPFWLMRCLYQTIAHPRGGYISTRLFVPREVWSIKGVKIRSMDEKISACELISNALTKLASVKQDDVNAIFEEMQSLEGVLDRVQTLLAKKLGSEVGPAGARTLYQADGSNSEMASNNDMVTKTTNFSGGRSYFSLRKLRTKNSNTTLSNAFSTSNSHLANAGEYHSSSVPMAGASADTSQQPRRNLENVTFGGPNAAYICALARLFDAAQILDRLIVFDEKSLPKKAHITTRIGLELSHRHAAEFFGFYICRFVLADVSLLLDKFVKRGSEWVSQ
ncbi:hypothetical protein RUND412_006134 [Rhizina undulata]